MKYAQTSQNSITKNNSRKYAILLVVIWLWPLALLLATFHWHDPFVGLRLLYKSTWVLFAAVLQGWVLYSFYVSERGWKNDNWLLVLGVLSVASMFLLPFGLCRWEWTSYLQFGRAISWSYEDKLLLSMFIHFAPFFFVKGLADGD